MSPISSRFQRLEPLSIGQRISIALAALRFFSPLNYEENCVKLGMEAGKKSTRPFSGMDFVRFLSVPGVLPESILTDPNRHYQRIDELLRSLDRSGFLSYQGCGQSPFLGSIYYTFREMTEKEKSGALFLGRALGPSFLHWAYKNGTYQITGATENGDRHAGTAIAIAPRWLMTCAHVVNDMQVDLDQNSNGKEFKIIKQIPHHSVDVAIIEVDRDLQVVQGLNFKDPSIGERVYTFGYPRIPLSREASLVMQGGEVSVEEIRSFKMESFFSFLPLHAPEIVAGQLFRKMAM
ncbi:S1 family peptidase [Paracidovorax konjaci]|uniref:Trypsin-like peptidase domain-containing protein n=1 Tax=Paracidovorax konjaci TaxID=32040 RepID=A0A1I1T1X6_9BURK|nr:serine protease [Paracidovorax konjaci]SFD52677.1 Trypsin-like peptidase domain-containing protein [Paracidovorax konjaci]